MKKEFVKPSHLIHIVHNLSLIQAKVFDFILAQSSPEDFLTKSNYTLPLSSIINFLGNTRNHKHLKMVIEGLGAAVTSTVLKRDSTQWGAFKLFSCMQVIDGIVHYSYPQGLKNILADPEVYSRINLATVLKFKSKYALFLYQLCLDYKKINQTPWLTKDEFCRYMHLDPVRFPEFYLLNFHIIKKAVRHMNSVSDIVVTPLYQKEGRRNVAVKFTIKKNN